MISSLNKCSHSRKRGFSLVEVLLALAVLAMAILTILGLLNAAFDTVSENLQTSQALTVRDTMDRALLTPTDILDENGVPVVTQASLPDTKFSYVYDWVKDKTGKSWNDAAFFVVFSRRLNEEEDDAPQMISQAMYCSSATAMPGKDTLDNLNQDGNAYLVRLFISPELDGQYINMDENGEVANSRYSIGSTLPAKADQYALPYLPMTIEIYPFAIGLSKQAEDQIPIFSNMLILAR
ncbi:MAG: prepilin-type N-terminal cleavage/methylation domain-containing protein [Opitutales bacterium]|nr:prepilin-type N-terminal cleavage/methylation domain-containing protein [Opitutales bacterium]